MLTTAQIFLLVYKCAWISEKYRSNRSEVSFKNCVLKIFAKFTGKHLYQSLFLMLQASTLLKKRLCHGCLTFFEAHLFRVKLPTNINVHNKIHGNLYGIAVFAGQKICRISSLFRFVEALSKCWSLVTDASKYLS